MGFNGKQLLIQLVVGLVVLWQIKDMTPEKMAQYLDWKQWFAPRAATAHDKFQQNAKVAFTLYLIYYLIRAPKKLRLYAKKSEKNQLLYKSDAETSCLVPAVGADNFWPSLWAPIGFVQFFAGTMLAKLRWSYQNPMEQWQREYLQRPADEEAVALDWFKSAHPEAAKKWNIFVVLTPNPLGSYSYEAITFGEAADRRGWRTCVVNSRGHAQSKFRCERPDSSKKGKGAKPTEFSSLSDYADLKAAVDMLKGNEAKGVKIVVVSFSTASAIATRYLAETGDKANIAGAICISPVMNMSAFYERKLPMMYTWQQLPWWKEWILRPHYETIEEQINEDGLDEADNASTVQEFTEKVNIKMQAKDYATPAEYYREHSITELGKGISKPLLYLASSADPVVPFESCIDKELFKSNSCKCNPVLAVADRAGHLHFFESLWAKNFTCRVADQFGKAAIELEKKSS